MTKNELLFFKETIGRISSINIDYLSEEEQTLYFGLLTESLKNNKHKQTRSLLNEIEALSVLYRLDIEDKSDPKEIARTLMPSIERLTENIFVTDTPDGIIPDVLRKLMEKQAMIRIEEVYPKRNKE